MRYLRMDLIARTPVEPEPFEHMIVENAINPAAAESLARDYPQISKPGSFAIEDVAVGPALRGLIDELDGEGFRGLVEDKFGLDLQGRPTVYSLRGHCSARDGRIHTDSRSKIVTVLLYLNDRWAEDGGRLRLLRNGEDIEAFAAEVPPTFGRMLIFRRSHRSWHGHLPFDGPRRVLQMNYVAGVGTTVVSRVRRRLSALAKSF